MKLTVDGTDVEEPMAALIPSVFAPDCLVMPTRGKRRPDHDELLRAITKVQGKMAAMKQEIFKPRITRIARMGSF